ncbi:Ornithine decarboxylase [Papilio xuthus]|uniref:ornithine decarboxylase n=1 Tax=Papilio xuthus TaxID=66420 RepID=A0A194Q6I1_PAPXU|nr:Ornithine decarboxylase [Papilio xuthus]
MDRSEVNRQCMTMNGELQNGFAMHSGAFVLETHSPADIARTLIDSGRQKEPFYVFDMDEAHRRIQHFKSKMPRVQIFYAMKSNDSEYMLKLAIASGLGFDCASPGEIYKLRKLNVNPKSIIYAMPSKTAEQMIYARDSGVLHTTFDSSYELKKIKQNWPDARLLVRIRVEGKSVYNLGDKFGCGHDTEAIKLLDEAAALGLKVVGVAFHVGSACSSIDSHENGLRYARALFEHEAKAGRQMKIVDIGGGFLSDKTDRIDQVANIINKALDEYFPDKSVQVIAEPGRYICDSSYTLYCSINNVRKVIKDKEVVNMIYLNDGLYGTLRYNESWHKVKRYRVSTDEETLEKAILWGPSCDSTDRIMENFTILLPQCSPRDWLILPIQGAYSFGFATHFSCLPMPRTRIVISSELWYKLKDSKVFKTSDFVVKPDINEPLPTTMPKVITENITTDVKSLFLLA